jgi:hypothetical protein
MAPLIIIVLIVGIVLFGISFIGAALHFLLWIGLIIVVIAIVLFIVRQIRARV